LGLTPQRNSGIEIARDSFVPAFLQIEIVMDSYPRSGCWHGREWRHLAAPLQSMTVPSGAGRSDFLI